MNGIYLIIGGNIGNRIVNLEQCRFELEKSVGKLLATSSIYETAAWGKEDEMPYLNQVLEIETQMNPAALMQTCIDIELRLGRTRNQKWEARVIDIDILFYHQEIIELPNLSIPHPHLHKRKFVLIPMHELAPDFIHPIFHRNIHDLLTDCEDPLEVRVFEEHKS
jgi:2-amino-4-hydroxy-6-hydroxymethyldihydropteridine diphosphokinase